LAFEPDIIVTVAEGSEISLVAEVKTSLRDLEASKLQLKKFMAGMRCPVGLLVTPERLLLFRDRYLSSSTDSIAEIGEFDVKGVLNFKLRPGPAQSLKFEQLVQSWLERLATESGLCDLPPGLRRVVQLDILPAISQSPVRAGHPSSAPSGEAGQAVGEVLLGSGWERH
jgi:hypothetical protein